MEQKDIIIIGGGPAGYVAAIRAARLGSKAVLIEKDTLGGTCLNHGCIPTRTLVRGVELLDLPKKAKDYGINLGQAEFSFAKLMARKDIVVKTMVGGIDLLMRENGIEVIKGNGRFLSSSTVEVQMIDGTSRQLMAQKIIIATGSSPKKPAIPGEAEIITTDEALQFKEIPRSMLVIGGRAIGFAFATIFARLGTSITVTESSRQILPGIDREIVALFERELRKEKIKLLAETEIKSVKAAGDEKNVILSTKGQETTLSVQYVLLADQRQANIDGFGLEQVGVNISNGAISVNKRMETSVAGIFAAGDVTGEPMLAHIAYAQGRTAAENALGKGNELDYTVVPQYINTFPEIASVGLTEKEAQAKGYQLKIGSFNFAANGMATILGERTGTIKLISEAKYGQILGVHIIGPHAADLIPEAALAMKLDATPAEISSTIHAHPSLAEALMEAALDVTGDTLHLMPSKK